MRFGATELLIILILCGGLVVLVVFYLKNLQDLLKECDPKNRQVPPGNVWLMLIPLFNYVYGFILYPKISETLRREFEDRNSPQSGDYLKVLGILMPSMNVAGLLPIPLIKVLVGLGGLVVFIMYWVQSANMKNILRSLPKGDGTTFIMSEKPDLLD
ncbi:MAG: hypothetical protein K0S23_680 [Fluviicola sp.]|jgi:hypothetical protein|uniref:hypothetical protein n=1 Tax=Fluviicola sp. TaxID=1917219 RepID=UPI0026358F83|nr:hypothetical protein [Fluviicola sp.]MDF3026373.1 hypothetical protein [Fluviicola sp.]